MDGEPPRALTRRRLLGTVISTGFAAGSIGAAVWGLTNQAEAASSIRASSREPELRLSGTTGYDLSNIAPGSGETGIVDVTLETETGRGKRLAINVLNHEIQDDDGDLETGISSGPESDTAEETAAGLAGHIRVDTLSYTRHNGKQSDLLGAVDIDGDSSVTLEELASATSRAGILDDLRPPKPNHPTKFRMQVTVGDFGNDYQGDILRTEITFSLIDRKGGAKDDGGEKNEN